MDSRMLYPNCSEYTYAIPIGEVPEGFVAKLEEFIEKEERDCNVYEDEIGGAGLLVIDGYDGDMGEGVGDFLAEEIETRGIDIEGSLNEARLETPIKTMPRAVKKLLELYNELEPLIYRGMWTRELLDSLVVEFTDDGGLVDLAFYRRMIEILRKKGVRFCDKTGFHRRQLLESKPHYALLFGDEREKNKVVERALETTNGVDELHYLALINGTRAEAKKKIAKRIVEGNPGAEALLRLLPRIKQATVRNIIGAYLLGRKESTRHGEIVRAVAKHCTGKLREEAEIQAATCELQGEE